MHRLLDKLQNFHQGSLSVQDYMITFDDLTLHCEVQEDHHQAIFKFCSGLRFDIQRAMLIHSQNMTFLAQASQLAQDIENSLKFPSVRRLISKPGEQSRRQPEDTSDITLMPLRTPMVSQ